MHIRLAASKDIPLLSAHDHHIRQEEWPHLIALSRVYIAEQDGMFLGWLRYGLFWDNTPFLNMLYLLETYREQGYGSRLLARWESDMKAAGYPLVMTSTPSDETSQHFYRKQGYAAIGGFIPPDDPFELIMSKHL